MMHFRHNQLSIVLSILACLATGSASAQAHYQEKLTGTPLHFEMKSISAGTYQRGSAKGNPDERPVHAVYVDAFWMSATEVTWDIYELFVFEELESRIGLDPLADSGLDGVTRPTKPYLDMTFGMGKSGYPAVGMTQYNAIQFCKWLYLRTGNFYRLPTEAEWEYACKAGSTTDYHFGNSPAVLADYAWYEANSNGKTQPVGKKKPNAFGLYDMHGNVSEWTIDEYVADVYSTYKEGLIENPVVYAQELYPLVLKGGSFRDLPEDLRSATRIPSQPAWKAKDPQIPKSNWWFPDAPFVGVRLVRPLVTPSQEEIDAYYNQTPIEDY